MSRTVPCLAATLLLSAAVHPTVAATGAAAGPGDPRLRDITYDPQTVVTVPVQRGVVTLIQLDPDESIAEVATGLGADCHQAEAAWCIAAQPGGQSLFVKPKSSASASNNLTVLTDRHAYAFRLVLASGEPTTTPLYRLTVHAPSRSSTTRVGQIAGHGGGLGAAAGTAEAGSSLALPAAVLLARDETPNPPPPAPRVFNAAYSLAEGAGSSDIVPTLVFDDGRFTYFRFPGNRPVPAVFAVLADDSETVVNTRMQDDLLVVDLVSRRLVLRSGGAVVGIWNEAFDLDGTPPSAGTTVPGWRRVLRGSGSLGSLSAPGATP